MKTFKIAIVLPEELEGPYAMDKLARFFCGFELLFGDNLGPISSGFLAELLESFVYSSLIQGCVVLDLNCEIIEKHWSGAPQYNIPLFFDDLVEIAEIESSNLSEENLDTVIEVLKGLRHSFLHCHLMDKE